MTTTSKKPAAISALRQRMIDDMTARKLQPGTQRGHLRGCKRFAIWLGRAPDEASADDVRAFQLHLAETGLSITTRNQTMTGVKFLFRVTLRRHDLAAEIYHLREPQKVPLVMSSQEVERLLAMAGATKTKAMLSISYGCGLRAGEVVRLKVGDIDSDQNIIRVVQSKGRKDRHVMLPPDVLDLLRQWWKERPTCHDSDVTPLERWLFPGRSPWRPLTTRQFDRRRIALRARLEAATSERIAALKAVGEEKRSAVKADWMWTGAPVVKAMPLHCGKETGHRDRQWNRAARRKVSTTISGCRIAATGSRE